MFTLASGWYKYLTQKEDYYIIILGLDNAGKTTLLERIKSIFLGVPGLPPERITPTVGLNIGKILIDSSRINFWDLGGQSDLQTLWDNYYEECHAIVFVVDSTDTERMEEVVQVFGTGFGHFMKGQQLLKQNPDLEKILDHDEVISVPILVLANKQDTSMAAGIHDIKEIFNRLASKMSARESNSLAVSALKGDGVKEAVEWLYLRIVRNKDSRPPIYRNS